MFAELRTFPSNDSKQFFTLLHRLFDSMETRHYSFEDMKKIVAYEKRLSDENSVIPNEDFNRGLNLLITTCEEIDVDVRKHYLWVVKLLYTYVEDCEKAMEYAFSLEFFTRHNRVNSHRLADHYENFYQEVDSIFDWIECNDIDENADDIMRTLGFYAIIHPLDVIREIVKKAIEYLYKPLRLQHLHKICESMRILFKLHIPSPQSEYSESTEAAFLCMLRRFIYLEWRIIDMGNEDDQFQMGVMMLSFLRSEFRQVDGELILIKDSIFNTVDFICNFVIDFLVKEAFLDFFLCLTEELFLVVDEWDNKIQLESYVEGEERCVRMCRFPLSAHEEDSFDSLDVFRFMRVMADVFAREKTAPRHRTKVLQIFALLAKKIDSVYGHGFFDNALPLRCEWMVDLMKNKGGALWNCFRTNFQNLIYQASKQKISNNNKNE